MDERKSDNTIVERRAPLQDRRSDDGIFRELIENSSDIITILDAEGIIRYESPSVERVLGYKPAELIGINIVDLLHPDDVPKMRDTIEALVSPGRGQQRRRVTEARLRHRGGAWHVLESVGKVLTTSLVTKGIVINSRDITDRKREQEARERFLEQVRAESVRSRALSHRLVEVQENERQRIARELHDDICQILSGLIMELGVGKELLSDARSSEQVRLILHNAEQMSRNALLTIRRMITDLRPLVLDDLGLVPAVHHLVDKMYEQTDPHVTIQINALPQRLPLDVETALFRIIQESLTNIRNHARAHHATIALTLDGGQVNLLITDDGIGIQSPLDLTNNDQVQAFDHESLRHGHFGLIGMRERTEQIGGTLHVQSDPKLGTTIRVELPLPKGEAPWESRDS